MCGIKDSRVQRRLLSETDLTFKKAFELAQASEVAEKNARDLHKPTGAVDAIRTQQPPKKNSNATMYREAGARPVYILTRNTREWNYNIRKYCRPVYASESVVFGLSQWRRLK